MNQPTDSSFFGHPRGLATLFFTEMWERFSYYGMRALLLLFMVATVENGGLGLDDKTAGAVYGLYTMFVYLLALPGGWLADRFFGLRKAVFYGGCMIAVGNLMLVLPYTQTFFVGLLLIVMGTGLLKPNVSSLVGELYPADQQAKRDAGFSIFYMGINLGAFISPFITGYLGENINWHYGFAVAGIGMVIGLIQYKATEKHLGSAGEGPNRLEDATAQGKREQSIRAGLMVFVGGLIVFMALLLTRTISINPITFAQASTYLIAASAAAYFFYILLFEKLEPDEKRKIGVIGVFFVASSMFYGGYEQQGSTLNLFADRYTDMFIGTFKMPASWLQSVPPFAVFIFAPIFAYGWVWLAKRNLNPSTPVKLAAGLLFMGAGYLVMMWASTIVIGGSKALPTWLVATYVLHTFGEICLYPVGLSAVTKLSPRRLVGQMMGIWFMSLALGNLVAGLFAGEFDANAVAANPQLLVDLFWVVVKVMGVAGLVVLVISKPIRKWMADIL
ncbi:MAG TPA: peptide MFS transporter [Cyclobacteriaceae bacterium]|nr:peptide MFS transporter [Cyclobacteriaceae bacterium]